MDAALQLTPLGVTVLALLRERDMHPYEMLRLLLHRQRHRVISITKGALYHTVTALERYKLITEVGTDREGKRPERTHYTLLPKGRDSVIAWVRAELPSMKSTGHFRLALMEAHNLPRAEALSLLKRRQELLSAEHESCRSALEMARSNAVPEQYLIDMDRHTDLLTAELQWLGQMLQRFSTSDHPWVGDNLTQGPSRS